MSSPYAESSPVIDPRWRWVPFLTPALQENSCHVDYPLVYARGRIILAIVSAVHLFAGIVLSALRYQRGLPTIHYADLGNIAASCSLVSFILPELDKWATERASRMKAVNEYLKLDNPSESATYIIRHNVKLLQSLIDQKADLNKVDQGHRRLIDPSLFVTFKLLVDNGADVTLKRQDKGIKDEFQVSYFQELVEGGEAKRLEYVLETHRVKHEDFTQEEQFELWERLGSIQIGLLLQQYGFTVDSPNREGHTPLLAIIKERSEDFSSDCDNKEKKEVVEETSTIKNHFSFYDHVRTLLYCGANPKKTVSHKGREQNAWDLCSTKDTQLQEILKPYFN